MQKVFSTCIRMHHESYLQGMYNTHKVNNYTHTVRTVATIKQLLGAACTFLHTYMGHASSSTGC